MIVTGAMGDCSVKSTNICLCFSRTIFCGEHCSVGERLDRNDHLEAGMREIVLFSVNTNICLCFSTTISCGERGGDGE